MANGNGRGMALPISLVVAVVIAVIGGTWRLSAVNAASEKALSKEIGKLNTETVRIKTVVAGELKLIRTEMDAEFDAIREKMSDNQVGQLDRWTGTDQNNFELRLGELNQDIGLKIPTRR